MDEHCLKHVTCAWNLELSLKIFKNKLSILQKFQLNHKLNLKPKKNDLKNIPDDIETEIKIPQYMTLSKLDWDNNEIHAGIIKDPTAKGGLRYQVIEPVLSERDQKAFEIIKKFTLNKSKTKN